MVNIYKHIRFIIRNTHCCDCQVINGLDRTSMKAGKLVEKLLPQLRKDLICTQLDAIEVKRCVWTGDMFLR